VPVVKRDEFLGAVRADPDHHWQAKAKQSGSGWRPNRPSPARSRALLMS
jgi:hypothetical protein